jgi:DNA-binding beta-propeller fold protein YncE
MLFMNFDIKTLKRKAMKKVCSVISLFLILSSMTILKGQTSGYKIDNKIKLPGAGGWDYLSVDEVNNKLFVSHGTVVLVVDLKTGQLAATIEDTPGVHGIAIANDLNKAFISCGRSNSVKVVDLKSFAVIKNITGTGINPDAILYDQFSKKVLTFNGRSSNATVIDAVKNQILDSIPLAGKPEFPVTDGKGTIYVNIEDKSLIAVIDAKTMKVMKSWPIAPGEEASGLALDNETHRLFSVCSNKLMVVVDAMDGKVVASLPIGEGCDGVKFDPTLKRAYSSNGEGTMTVVQEVDKDNFKVLENFPTQRSARTLAVDTRSHHIYMPCAEFGPAPAATTENPRPRPTIKPDTFGVLDIAPVK